MAIAVPSAQTTKPRFSGTHGRTVAAAREGPRELGASVHGPRLAMALALILGGRGVWLSTRAVALRHSPERII
jgi:hypothetical protein